MEPIAFFKLQSKNLFKDYQTITPYIDDIDGNSYYKYYPKYFDIGSIVLAFDIDEHDFSLMKAQHVIACMVGFDKWTNLLKADSAELELAKLLFDNQDKIFLEEWYMYVCDVERENKLSFDSEERLQLFKDVFLNGGNFYNPFPDYRLNPLDRIHEERRPESTTKIQSSVQITSLPLSNQDRLEFIELANQVFETVMDLMEAANPELTRKLWNAGEYVDNLLREDMLPICRDYALSLIEPFMIHIVANLSSEADKMVEQA
jgi:hypothetical protein